MRFSVIVPVYNVEQYLEQCLESLQAQSYSDFEVVCVNDGSTDRSREILSEWVPRMPQMRVIDRENGGLSAARNTGLSAAKGDYVLFVDSDDWLETNALEVLSKNLRLPTSDVRPLDMICFASQRTDSNRHDTLIDEQCDGWSYYNRHALEARVVPFVCVWQRCYRRQFLEDNNLRFLEGILHEDNEFTPRACLKANSVKVVPDVLYHYRVRPNSIMTTRGMKSKESLITIANKLSKLFNKEAGIEKTAIFRALTQYYQVAFIDNTYEEDERLLSLIDWKCYRRVCNTKARHFFNYMLLRIHPSLFHWFNQ